MALFKKRSTSRINMMDLPSEVLIDIFSRLPFNSIMQLCKLFPHIVLRPEFERFYLHSHPFTFLAFNTSTQQHDIVEHRHGRDHLIVSTKLNLIDFVSKHQNLDVVASCNGLLLGRIMHICNGLISESLRLVNPLTEYCDILAPAERIDLNGWSLIKYGLGYSYSANLYKVVCLDVKSVNILTVNHTNTWRKVDCDQIIECFPYLEDGVAMSGGIHWLVGGGMSSNMILRFDVDEEVFDFVPMAYEKGSCSYVMSQLSMLGGSLCALANHIGWYEGDKVEVWVMKEYGVGNSWTRMTVLQCIPEFDYDLAKVKVIHVVDGGKLLMKLKNALRVYDLAQRKWEDGAERVTMDQVMMHFQPSFLSSARA